MALQHCVSFGLAMTVDGQHRHQSNDRVRTRQEARRWVCPAPGTAPAPVLCWRNTDPVAPWDSAPQGGPGLTPTAPTQVLGQVCRTNLTLQGNERTLELPPLPLQGTRQGRAALQASTKRAEVVAGGRATLRPFPGARGLHPDGAPEPGSFPKAL